MSGPAWTRRARILAMCLVSVAVASPAASQGPLDIFGTHSGTTRRPTIADQKWFAFSALLLTEFDGRFEDPAERGPAPDFRRHDDLQTSAGYNYATYGQNHILSYNAENWFPFLPTNTALTVAWSTHAGFTKDEFILRGVQDALHRFRGVTQNYRPDVQDNFVLAGGDVEALFWPEGKWLAIGGHYTRGTYHHEGGASMTVVNDDSHGKAKVHLTATRGWLFGSGVGPSQIAVAFDDAYWMLRAGVEHTDRYGLSVGYSDGIFPGEREFMLSMYVGVELPANWWLRGEFVNDMLGGKDRGLTGGGRLALSRTF